MDLLQFQPCTKASNKAEFPQEHFSIIHFFLNYFIMKLLLFLLLPPRNCLRKAKISNFTDPIVN